MPGMNIALAVSEIAFAAFCVWLGVRIVNRRERWAKRTAIVIVLLLSLYVLSSGPTRWIAIRGRFKHAPLIPGGPITTTLKILGPDKWWQQVYSPLLSMSKQPWGGPIDWYWHTFAIYQLTDEYE